MAGIKWPECWPEEHIDELVDAETAAMLLLDDDDPTYQGAAQWLWQGLLGLSEAAMGGGINRLAHAQMVVVEAMDNLGELFEEGDRPRLELVS